MIQHKNRRGKDYYLHQGVTKTGKAKYHFSKIREGANVAEIPRGFEIYETPNAQVFLRKIRPQIVTHDELSAVESGLQKYCNSQRWIVDTKKNIISIYLPDQNADNLTELLTMFYQERGELNPTKLKESLEDCLTYSPLLQFVLTDKKQRLFQTRRFCFLGDIDDWIDIGETGGLQQLVETYAPHLGEESYFELF